MQTHFTLTIVKSSFTHGTARQRQTKTTGSILRKQTWHSRQGHSTIHQRCFSFELFCGWPNTHRAVSGSPHGLTMQSSIMQPRCCSGAAMLASHVRWSFLQPQISKKHSPHQHAIYFATRYVDNRVLLLPEQLLSLPPFKQLTSASFYKPPVQLETEPANIFLGFAVDPSQRTVTHQSQLTTADILHPRSATTAQTLRSSFQARTRLINRVTHPHEATFSAIRAMRSTYQAAGYVDSQL